jgi:hypothetical protein
MNSKKRARASIDLRPELDTRRAKMQAHIRIAAMAKPADVDKEGGIQTTKDVWKASDFSESTRKKLPSAADRKQTDLSGSGTGWSCMKQTVLYAAVRVAEVLYPYDHQTLKMLF